MYLTIKFQRQIKKKEILSWVETLLKSSKQLYKHSSLYVGVEALVHVSMLGEINSGGLKSPLFLILRDQFLGLGSYLEIHRQTSLV